MQTAIFKEKKKNRLLWAKGVGVWMEMPDPKAARINNMGVNEYVRDLWTWRT